MQTSYQSYPMRELAELQVSEKLNFELVIQRKKDIWDAFHKSSLIRNMLRGALIPPLYAKVEDGVFSFIDGKQRLTSFLAYTKDEYALHGKTPDFEGYEIAGKRFSELPEAYKNKLLDSTFMIGKIEQVTDEELEEMFYYLNNGVPLKAIESIRVLLGSDNLKIVTELTEHSFFISKASISRKRYTDQEIAIQLLMILEDPNTGFSGKEIKTFVEKTRDSNKLEELYIRASDILNYLNKAFEKKERYMKKLHMPIIFYNAIRAEQMGISPKNYGEFIEGFYGEVDKNSPYWVACQSGSAKRENVQCRIRELRNSFYDSFTVPMTVS